MRQALHHLSIKTQGKGLVEITGLVRDFVAAQNMATGLLNVFCRHTSASLLIQENADPEYPYGLGRLAEALRGDSVH